MAHQYKYFLGAFVALSLSAGMMHTATAQDEKSGGVFDIPAGNANANADAASDAGLGEMTHPVLELTPDKSELVKLDQEAASVIVGNPNHVNVMLDTPDTLVVVPRAPGASYFSVVGKDGSIIMQRHVIVGGGAHKENYVRIRRSCAGSSSTSCAETSVYYCPDTCHEVSLNQGE